MSTNVNIVGVTKRFGDFVANDNINLDIKEGEFVSLLGPSGCGKTTLLSMVLGILDISEGSIYFGESKVDDIPIHKRDVGMVFQNYALFPHMNVFDNVGFGLKMRKLPKEQIKKEVMEALDLVQLGHLAHRYPKELSGGQQQRIAFARAIVVKPRVLLLDEPLSNLDAKLREEMRFELKKLHRKLGITTIYVTHDQIEALSLSTRIAVMKDGIVQQFGTPLDIFLNPANAFVASFVGYANFMVSQVLSNDGKLLKVKEEKYGYELELDIEDQGHKSASGLAVGDRAIISIKPESVKVIDAAVKPQGNNIIKAKVDVSDYTGTVTRYELVTDEGFAIKASDIGYSDYQPGEELYAYLQPGKFAVLKYDDTLEEAAE